MCGADGNGRNTFSLGVVGPASFMIDQITAFSPSIKSSGRAATVIG